MDRPPIKISWDELKAPSVEERLREQSTVSTTQSHYERAEVVAPKIAPPTGFRALLMSAPFYLAAFGLFGGITGWVIGEAAGVRPDRVTEAARYVAEIQLIDRSAELGKWTPEEAARLRARVTSLGSTNPYFAIQVDRTLTPEQRALKEAEARHADFDSQRRADILLFGIAGLFIAAALAMAERAVDRDVRGAVIDGTVGLIVGVSAGIVVALAAGRVEPAVLTPDATLMQRALVRAGIWCGLGALIGTAPGLALRSSKRTLLGAAGGLVGGAVGGLLFEPVAIWAGDAALSRLVGLAAIGAAAGAAMGVLENVAKQGWLRVVGGLITGKQFILYRNPTFVGSAPMSHIYLFKDPQVGRRHAAFYHVAGGGYELENLPLGGPTLVNDVPITRTRLRTGDRIKIGRTTLVFEEKAKS